MRYDVEVGGRRMRIETSDPPILPGGPAGGTRTEARLTLDDRVIAYDARELVPGRMWSVVVEGRAHEVVLLGGDPSTLPGGPARALIDGVDVAIRVADERAVAARRDRAATVAGRHEVRAPMPGLLKAVHVAEGDVVERNAALATLEAMKMENELRAPARARVQRVAASPGAKVESGALIAVLVDEPA